MSEIDINKEVTFTPAPGSRAVDVSHDVSHPVASSSIAERSIAGRDISTSTGPKRNYDSPEIAAAHEAGMSVPSSTQAWLPTAAFEPISGTRTIGDGGADYSGRGTIEGLIGQGFVAWGAPQPVLSSERSIGADRSAADGRGSQGQPSSLQTAASSSAGPGSLAGR